MTFIYDATAGTLATYQYSYDDAGRVTAETIDGTTRVFTYDDADQLTADGANTFTYDAAGNRSNTGWVTGAGNQLVSDGTWNYTYDLAGNRTKKTKGATQETWTFGYDNRNQLVWAGAVRRGIDMDGNNGDALLKRYVHGDGVDQIFARADGSYTADWYLTDRLGSVRKILGSGGSGIFVVCRDQGQARQLALAGSHSAR